METTRPTRETSVDVEIINIGDELLIGQVINTNAAWMAGQLNGAGFRVATVTVIADERQAISEALEQAGKRAPIVLISGGIGPTRDDITKQTLCEFFDTKLVFNTEAYRDIEALFARRGFTMTELNRMQAELPEACTSLPNKLGTARGMWFEKNTAGSQPVIYVSMPGVPFEMKEMMTLEVIPRLKKIFATPVIVHRTILTQGVGESFLAEQINAWELALPDAVKLAYLPQPGIVRLRLTGTGREREELDRILNEAIEKLYDMIPHYIFGQEQETLEQIVGKLLLERGQTLALAESCTGGYISHLITSVPGSSGWFRGSVVAYSNDLKVSLLGVEEESLRRFGAVSETVVREMAIGAQHRLNAGYAIATSCVAGPDGGSAEKPVGTTWIAIATPDDVISSHFLYGDNRERNIRRTTLQALNMLRKQLVSW
jgi:nicotinamide-nucleotide amidase